jgi:glycosyltransferase involved in cell wall biosynthesis
LTADARRRRIALITNLCPHYRRPLYELLSDRFVLDCFFFAEPDAPPGSVTTVSYSDRITRVELSRISLLGQPLLPGLARRLTLARYDAIIMDLSGRLMVPYVYLVARARGIPFVLWTGVWHHPLTTFHRLSRGLTETVYRRSDAILVYGDHVRRALLAVHGVDDEKIFTAAQSVDGGRFGSMSKVAESRELLYVGRLEPEKGVSDLLAAFARVTDPSAQLAIAGSGSQDTDVSRSAAADPRLRVVGFVSQDDLPEHYARARALVVPSVTTREDREAWGLVVNEAMHVGLPVIATDAVGAAAHGLVEDGVTGLVVEEGDPEGLGAAMARVLADDQLASELGRRARERVSTYTFDAMADSFETAVEFGIRQHGGRITTGAGR